MIELAKSDSAGWKLADATETFTFVVSRPADAENEIHSRSSRIRHSLIGAEAASSDDQHVVTQTRLTVLNRGVHPRMPVILDEEEAALWMFSTTSPERALSLLIPAAAGTLAHAPVSTRVNRAGNDDPSLVVPVELAARLL